MEDGPMPRVCVLLAVVLAGCSLPLPTNDASVTAPRGEAPGHCAEVTEFAYVGVSTLRELGFDDTFGDDFERRGRFWVTAEPLDVRGRAAQEAAQQAEAARARGAGGQVMPPPEAPDPSAQRMLCVRWTDGNPTGLVDMAIPDNWSPPSN